jgi:hypothetical protein
VAAGSDEVSCDELYQKLHDLHKTGTAVQELEKAVRYSCVAVDVQYISEPLEEVQMANCPSEQEFNFRWHYVWQECGFENLGYSETSEWAIMTSTDGEETLDTSLYAPFKANPVCRGLASDLASLFVECPNSAPGKMGLLSRKAKALKNTLKTAGNPAGTVVARQQVAVRGVIDPLSNMELLQTEAFIKKQVIEATGVPEHQKDRVIILTQPVLHADNFQSRTPPTPNPVSARFDMPMGSYVPVSLADRQFGKAVRTKFCPVGKLCMSTAQPGPSADFKVDPAAHLFLTFNEPVTFGDCFLDGYSSCKIELDPQSALGGGRYTLDNSEFSSSSEVTLAGNTVQLKPRLFLQANTNYTVTIDAGVFKGIKSPDVESEKITYWFLTGPPTGGEVKVSVMIGCDDLSTCEYYQSYLPDYAGQTQTLLLAPLERHLYNAREERLAILAQEDGFDTYSEYEVVTDSEAEEKADTKRRLEKSRWHMLSQAELEQVREKHRINPNQNAALAKLMRENKATVEEISGEALKLWDEHSGEYVETIKSAGHAAGAARRNLVELGVGASHEGAAASSGIASLEARKLPQCETVGTWFLMCMISMFPVFLSLVAVWMTAQGVHPWLQDA